MNHWLVLSFVSLFSTQTLLRLGDILRREYPLNFRFRVSEFCGRKSKALVFMGIGLHSGISVNWNVPSAMITARQNWDAIWATPWFGSAFISFILGDTHC
jgi:hypothetical protein